MRSSKTVTGRITRWVQPVFFVVACISIALLLSSQWSELRAYPWTLNLGWFLAAIALLLVTWAVEVGIWWHMLQYMGGLLPYLAAVRIWFLSAVMRYIPGNIWQPLSMTLYCKRHGIRVEATLTSIVLYQVVILLAVAPIAAAYLLLYGNLGLLSDTLSAVTPGLIAIALAPVVLFLIRPEYLMTMLNWGLSKIGRPKLDTHLSSRRLFLLLVVAVVDWILWGATFAAFTFSLSEFDPASQIALAPHLIAAFPIAYAIGFLSLITPSGFGVREGAFFLLLSPLMDGVAITLIALAMRFWTAGGELLIAAHEFAL